MTATHPDLEALLRTVCDDLAADAPRLVVADWYSDKGQPERGELIRVQCELARPFAGPCRACGKPLGDDRTADGCPCNSPCGVNHGFVPAYVCTCPECDPAQTGSARDRPPHVDALRRRERELLVYFPAARYWGLPEFLEKSHPYRDVLRGVPAIRCFGKGVQEVAFEFRRGFVARITLTAARFAGGACGGCVQYIVNDTTYYRWVPNALGLVTPLARCPACRGTGRTEGLAGRLFAACPTVESVTLSDREPMERPIIWQRRGNLIDQPYRVPDVLFDLLGQSEVRSLPLGPDQREYLRPKDAVADLAAACLLYGNERAKG